MQDDAVTHTVKVSPVPNSAINGSDIKLDGAFVSGGAEPLVSHAEQNGRQYDGINNVITSLSRMNVSSLPSGNGIASVDQGSNFWAAQGMQGFQSEDGSNVQSHINSGNSSGVLSSPNVSQLLATQMPPIVGEGMQQVANRRPITGQQQLFPSGVTHNSSMFGNQQGKMWPPSFQQQQQTLLSQNQQNIALQNWASQNMPPDVAFQRFFPRLNVPSFDKKSFSYTPDLDMSAVVNAQGSKYGRSTSLPGQYGNFTPRMGFDAMNLQSFDGHFDNGGGYFPFNKVRTPDVNSFTQLESVRYHVNDGSEFNNHSDLDGFKASHQPQYYRGPSDGHLKGVRYNNFPDVPVDRSLAGLSLDLNGAGGDPNERYSRKVFVGGLPPDIDEAEITSAFCTFGSLIVDWPHKAESKSYFPPKGYCFLIFRDEFSVRRLAESSMVNDGKLYWCVSSPTMKDKPVQIRPWCLADSDFVLDASQPLDPRKTIFVGGVPRPLKALELAMIMERLYGGVCYAGIDTDPELKYPKGAGRIAFSSQQSYINAISARFIQLQHGDIDKRVEVKPYVLDDQLCDECQGAKCGGKFAPFFCANVTCLQYYCEHCWAQIHSHVGREYHKPLVKEGADRPRAIPFRWGQGGGPGFSQAS